MYRNGALEKLQRVCAAPAPQTCTVLLPGEQDVKFPGEFIIGAGAVESNGFRPHLGQMAMVRLLDVEMTAGEVRAAYEHRAQRFRYKVPEETYWSKSYGGGLVKSPSSFHADVLEMKNISLIGRFNRRSVVTCAQRQM